MDKTNFYSKLGNKEGFRPPNKGGGGNLFHKNYPINIASPKEKKR